MCLFLFFFFASSYFPHSVSICDDFSEKFGFADEAQSISEELESKDDEEMEFLDFIPKDNVTQIISIVQSTPTNNSAIGYVDYIYEYIRNATNNDPRIEYVYQILEDEDHSFLREDDADVFQMFTVGRNIYSLIDGAAMKEVWGCMMPHIIFGEDNLKAIAQQVIDAVEEEDMDAVVTTPRLSLVRFAGGSREMRTPFNTEKIDSEFSTVSVR